MGIFTRREVLHGSLSLAMITVLDQVIKTVEPALSPQELVVSVSFDDGKIRDAITLGKPYITDAGICMMPVELDYEKAWDAVILEVESIGKTWTVDEFEAEFNADFGRNA